MMMMTAQVSSPSLAAEMTALSVKRPSLSTATTTTTLKKRKLSSCSDDNDNDNSQTVDMETDEALSPTSLDELTASDNSSSSSSSADESSVISPKKKARAESSSSSAPILSAAINKWESSDAKPQSPSAVYAPIAFDAAPATPLDAQELEILNFFLA